MSNRFVRLGLSLSVICTLGGLAHVSSAADKGAAVTGQQACFERMKRLAGDWVGKDKSGKETTILRYRVISGGTALEEIVGPETEDMVSIYHMDRGRLVMTHYCMLGNQPHLMATMSSTPKRIEFVCDEHGSYKKSEAEMHIHHATFVLTSDDQFTSWWGANQNGKSAGPEDKFEVHRKAAQP